jgi:hypothetical protein
MTFLQRRLSPGWQFIVRLRLCPAQAALPLHALPCYVFPQFERGCGLAVPIPDAADSGNDAPAFTATQLQNGHDDRKQRNRINRRDIFSMDATGPTQQGATRIEPPGEALGAALTPGDFARVARYFGEPQLQLYRSQRVDGVPEVSMLEGTCKPAMLQVVSQRLLKQDGGKRPDGRLVRLVAPGCMPVDGVDCGRAQWLNAGAIRTSFVPPFVNAVSQAPGLLSAIACGPVH